MRKVNLGEKRTHLAGAGLDTRLAIIVGCYEQIDVLLWFALGFDRAGVPRRSASARARHTRSRDWLSRARGSASSRLANAHGPAGSRAAAPRDSGSDRRRRRARRREARFAPLARIVVGARARRGATRGWRVTLGRSPRCRTSTASRRSARGSSPRGASSRASPPTRPSRFWARVRGASGSRLGRARFVAMMPNLGLAPRPPRVAPTPSRRRERARPPSRPREPRARPADPRRARVSSPSARVNRAIAPEHRLGAMDACPNGSRRARRKSRTDRDFGRRRRRRHPSLASHRPRAPGRQTHSLPPPRHHTSAHAPYAPPPPPPRVAGRARTSRARCTR